MELEDLLVVYKKSRYAQYRDKSKKKIKHLLDEHRLHKETMKIARDVLKGANFIYRANLSEDIVKQAKLVVTIGGDGTVLDASHFCYDTPILGVNSTFDKDKGSEGFFCGANKFNLEETIGRLLDGKLKSLKLNRLQAEVNGNEIRPFALNEFLIADKCPAAGSYYTLKIGDKSEFQRTYGLLVSTSAGSTAAMKSHGGKIMPIRSKRLQYWARAPFDGRLAKHRLKKGILQAGSEIKLISGMREGRIYTDGSHCIEKFGLGDNISIRNSKHPLTIYNLDLNARKKHYK